MKLLAISGGVDSMLLAHKYKNKEIVLAFINYNVRNDTYIDQSIVEEFAKKNKLKLEKLILNGNESIGNFENWARNIRYDFFKKIYKKYNCSELLIAHHKDDFLETCLMQEEKNDKKLFYGIKKRTTYLGMKIYRPFLDKYWKNEIYELVSKNQIKYHDDYTNFDSKYKRNKIRKELSLLSNEEKQKMIDYFSNKNEMNKEIIKNINNEYKKWKLSCFSTTLFKDFKFQDELIKKYINLRAHDINLNNKIINNIINFINIGTSKGEKKFKLSKNNNICKKNKTIFFEKNIF